MSHKGNYKGKRTFDIVFSSVALLVLSPILLLIFIMIRVDDGAPTIFTQIRIGAEGNQFKLYKFRTMPNGTPDKTSTALGEVNLTKLSKFLRRSNLDELPQLFNILFGSMSIVGPRPALPSQLDLIEFRTENDSMICKPGLTGLAQIRSYDGMTVKKKSDFDNEYLTRVSILLDIKIIFGTFRYLLKPPPVY